MSGELALIKILEGRGDDLNHFLSAFPTQLLLRREMTKDANGRVEYIGYALSGATLSQAQWLIVKNIYDATGFQTQYLFANGEAKFNKVFNSGASEYVSYTYTTSSICFFVVSSVFIFIFSFSFFQ